ncbi:MAG: prohibitin family protein [Verrucomicrobia bacterium]|nr:prohibitin family protein [Verrucomicrobiota bacterium]
MIRNARQIWNEHKVLLVILGFAGAFLVAFFWRSIFIKIGSGEAGVLYRLFLGGTETEKVYGEGLTVIFPWDTMFIYNSRVQQVPDEFTVLSQDGLAIKIQISIRFRPEVDQIGLLHKHIGPDYIEKVVKPEVQSEFRYVLGQYKPEDIYTSQGFILQTVVQASLGQAAERYILLDDVLLKSVTLPPSVAEAIESKLRAQQLLQEYNYRVDTEKQEAQRKEIEAGGIKKFQDTVMSDLPNFNQYLRYRGIEATLELAKSPNSKIVIIGGGEDKLPVILDGTTRGDSVPATPAPPSRPARTLPPPPPPRR